MGKLRQMLGDDEIQRKPQTRAQTAPTTQMQQRRPQGVPLRGSMGNAQNLQSARPLEAAPDSADALQPLYPDGTMRSVQPAMRTYWQNTDGQLRNMVNPQVEDDGYYYN